MYFSLICLNEVNLPFPQKKKPHIFSIKKKKKKNPKSLVYTNHLVHGVCTNKPNNNKDKLKEREEDKDKLKGLVGISLSLSLSLCE